MTALSRALEDVTGSSEEGTASFESFASKIRENPLFKDVFKGLTEGLVFQEGRAEQSFVAAIDFFQKKVVAAKAAGNEHEVAVRNAQAAALGINSKSIDPAFSKLKEAFEKHQKELPTGYAKDAEDAAKLRVAINSLGNEFHNLAIAVAAPLFAPLKTLFEWLAKWIDDNKVYLIDLLKQVWGEIGKAAHDLDVVFGPVLRGMKALWDGLMEGIKENIGTDLTGLKGLHFVLAAILGAVTVAAMASMASMLTLGFAPFGVLAVVLTGILGTLTAINALFGGSASAAPTSGAGSIAGGGAQTYGGEAGAGGSSHIGGKASGGGQMGGKAGGGGGRKQP